MKNATQSKEGEFAARTPDHRCLRAGRSSGRVADQYFTIEDDVLVFCLVIDLNSDYYGAEFSNESIYRKLKWSITPETISQSMIDFKKLGYRGNTISGLDPTTDGFHNFCGLRVNLVCSIEKDLLFAQVDEFTSPPGSLLQHFDYLLKEFGGGSAVENRFGRTDYTGTDADPFLRKTTGRSETIESVLDSEVCKRNEGGPR